MKLYMFRTVRLSSGVYSLYTQRWCTSYRFVESFRAGPEWNNEYTPDDGQTNCPKHLEFHEKNKFVKLAHLVGFITKKYIAHVL